mgnify:CR=1 FL=1
MSAQHEIQIRVRYQETDGQGRLHHANFFTYFEQGRVELMRVLGHDYREFEAAGLFLVVAEIGCQFHQAASFDDVLTLRTTATRVRGVRIDHRYEVFKDGQLVAEGHSTVACVDRSGQVRRLPAWLREASQPPPAGDRSPT